MSRCIRIVVSLMFTLLFGCADGVTGGANGDRGREGIGADCLGDGGCEPPDDPNVCARQSVEASPVTPNVIFIVDRSGSMANELEQGDCSGGNCYSAGTPSLSRWDQLRRALVGPGAGAFGEGLIGDLEDEVRFGAMLYSKSSGSGCASLDFDLLSPSAGGADVVGVVDVTSTPGARQVIAVEQNYLGTFPGGWTPTGWAVDHALGNLDGSILTSGDPTIFILATDGRPNHAGCTPPGGLSAEAFSVDRVGAAHDMGIRTFVLAVASPSALPDGHVNALANAGVGSASGTSRDADWWRVQSVDALNDALETIIDGEISCTVDLEGAVSTWESDPCSGGEVTLIEAGGARSIVACDAADGWQLTSSQRVRLNGSACERLKSGAGARLEASFPCGVIVIG